VTCPCGQRHHLGATYYASVIKDPALGPKSQTVLAAGPYLTHPEALAVVNIVRRIVLDRYDRDGRACWFGYGTVGMRHDFTPPGKLNEEVAAALAAHCAPPQISPAQKRCRRAPKTIAAYTH
jgi:hypothetical protein